MQPELERLAREAGLTARQPLAELGPQLERFAMLVAQAENERLAKLCETMNEDSAQCEACAAAIRSSAPRANGGKG